MKLDQEQQALKRKARRRLVGAVATAMTAAVTLPMLMDYEPRTPAQDVQIRFPTQEGPNFLSRAISVRSETGSEVEDTSVPEPAGAGSTPPTRAPADLLATAPANGAPDGAATAPAPAPVPGAPAAAAVPAAPAGGERNSKRIDFSLPPGSVPGAGAAVVPSAPPVTATPPAAAIAPPPAAIAPPSEAAREDMRRREELKRQDELRRKEDEARRKEELRRKEDEARRKEESRRKEEDARRKQEEQRREEARRDELRRKEERQKELQKEREQKEREQKDKRAQDDVLKAERARVEAILMGSAEARRDYVIQLGSFRDEENVRQLKAKLKSEGLIAQTETVGDKVRVRLGPYGSREAADNVQQKLKRLGITGVLTAK